MRKIRYIVAAAALVTALNTRAQGIDGVLRQIEENNLSLRAHSSLTEARTLDARTANQLPNPQVQYVHAWGTPAEAEWRVGSHSVVRFPDGLCSSLADGQDAKLALHRRPRVGASADSARSQATLHRPDRSAPPKGGCRRARTECRAIDRHFRSHRRCRLQVHRQGSRESRPVLLPSARCPTRFPQSGKTRSRPPDRQ